ncbi:MAG: hypothetical protein HGA80_07425 [Candidatus Omnitrophica bacterium]|nr:hypothetical protein [Candidatus Omnitrophota bacterium]
MNEYLSLMLSLVREGGEIALELIERSRPELKSDNSVITEADRRISVLAHQKLAGYLASGQHLLIDEEDPRRGEHLEAAFQDRVPLVWSLDPVDGTRIYANHMPHYGISIGLLKERRPWLGAVFFPSLDELFYCDGTEAFFVRHPFTTSEARTRIVPVDEAISSRSLMIVTDELPRFFEWHSTDCRLLVMSAAVCEFCWPTIGRGCGSLSRVHLWDMAGSWPIVEKAGLRLFSIDTGEPLERLDAETFEKSCRLKGYHILSSPRNFPILKTKLVIKGDAA